ncbi:MAG: acyl-CoA dehydrogenase family protein [Deltaproteobacteria bacterium]|nr:acyl-CoA dehydrogenase family protein [Deltaproteobacteria bacterium]MDQ3296639.1 acyl-CoA dehydrogenase family protein [Myxococcota bacterium]
MEQEAVQRARGAAEVIQPLVEAIERDRGLPREAVDALVGAGVFKLCVPRVYGGAQAEPTTVLAVIEELAKLDGSVGWCAMIGVTSGLMSGYLDDSIAREVYGPPDAVTSGVFAPMGRAVATPGGYRVSGRWSFASGCEHARWRMGGTMVGGDAPEVLPSGAPDVRCVLFRADETTIHDTWDTMGLRGTGSHDLEVRDVVVPRERTFSLLSDKPKHAGYALPFFGLLASGVAAVGLGIARAALDGFVALAGHKNLPGGKKTIAHREVVQIEVARAEARLRAARGLLFEAMAEATIEAGNAVADADPRRSVPARARLRLAACHAATEAAAVTAIAYELGGGAAVYRTSPLQRQFRDAHVVTHHLMVSSVAMTTAGRILLGVETDTSTL